MQPFCTDTRQRLRSLSRKQGAREAGVRSCWLEAGNDVVMKSAAMAAGRSFPALNGSVLPFALDANVATEWAAANARLAPFTQTAPGIDYPGNVNPGDRRALYHLVRALRPRSILEVGTHLGSSTLYMAEAMRRNQVEGWTVEGLHTVDVVDVNDPRHGAWTRLGGARSPREAAKALGLDGTVTFHHRDSVAFLSETELTFDFVFLDGSHEADIVYAELQGLPDLLRPGATVLLHDFFPKGRPLWPDGKVIAGPWEAVARMIAEGADLTARPLGDLPWLTKQGVCATSLALVGRS